MLKPPMNPDELEAVLTQQRDLARGVIEDLITYIHSGAEYDMKWEDWTREQLREVLCGYWKGSEDAANHFSHAHDLARLACEIALPIVKAAGCTVTQREILRLAGFHADYIRDLKEKDVHRGNLLDESSSWNEVYPDRRKWITVRCPSCQMADTVPEPEDGIYHCRNTKNVLNGPSHDSVSFGRTHNKAHSLTELRMLQPHSGIDWWIRDATIPEILSAEARIFAESVEAERDRQRQASKSAHMRTPTKPGFDSDPT
jgi:ribosomal protein L37AE/L43A